MGVFTSKTSSHPDSQLPPKVPSASSDKATEAPKPPDQAQNTAAGAENAGPDIESKQRDDLYEASWLDSEAKLADKPVETPQPAIPRRPKPVERPIESPSPLLHWISGPVEKRTGPSSPAWPATPRLSKDSVERYSPISPSKQAEVETEVPSPVLAQTPKSAEAATEVSSPALVQTPRSEGGATEVLSPVCAQTPRAAEAGSEAPSPVSPNLPQEVPSPVSPNLPPEAPSSVSPNLPPEVPSPVLPRSPKSAEAGTEAPSPVSPNTPRATGVATEVPFPISSHTPEAVDKPTEVRPPNWIHTARSAEGRTAARVPASPQTPKTVGQSIETISTARSQTEKPIGKVQTGGSTPDTELKPTQGLAEPLEIAPVSVVGATLNDKQTEAHAVDLELKSTGRFTTALPFSKPELASTEKPPTEASSFGPEFLPSSDQLDVPLSEKASLTPKSTLRASESSILNVELDPTERLASAPTPKSAEAPTDVDKSAEEGRAAGLELKTTEKITEAPTCSDEISTQGSSGRPTDSDFEPKPAEEKTIRVAPPRKVQILKPIYKQAEDATPDKSLPPQPISKPVANVAPNWIPLPPSPVSTLCADGTHKQPAPPKLTVKPEQTPYIDVNLKPVATAPAVPGPQPPTCTTMQARDDKAAKPIGALPSNEKQVPESARSKEQLAELSSASGPHLAAQPGHMPLAVPQTAPKSTPANQASQISDPELTPALMSLVAIWSEENDRSKATSKPGGTSEPDKQSRPVGKSTTATYLDPRRSAQPADPVRLDIGTSQHARGKSAESTIPSDQATRRQPTGKLTDENLSTEGVQLKPKQATQPVQLKLTPVLTHASEQQRSEPAAATVAAKPCEDLRAKTSRQPALGVSKQEGVTQPKSIAEPPAAAKPETSVAAIDKMLVGSPKLVEGIRPGSPVQTKSERRSEPSDRVVLAAVKPQEGTQKKSTGKIAMEKTPPDANIMRVKSAPPMEPKPLHMAQTEGRSDEAAKQKLSDTFVTQASRPAEPVEVKPVIKAPGVTVLDDLMKAKSTDAPVAKSDAVVGSKRAGHPMTTSAGPKECAKPKQSEVPTGLTKSEQDKKPKRTDETAKVSLPVGQLSAAAQLPGDVKVATGDQPLGRIHEDAKSRLPGELPRSVELSLSDPKEKPIDKLLIKTPEANKSLKQVDSLKVVGVSKAEPTPQQICPTVGGSSPTQNVFTTPTPSGAPTPPPNTPPVAPVASGAPTLHTVPTPSGAPTPAPGVPTVSMPSGAPTAASNLPAGPIPSGVPTPAPNLPTGPTPSGAPTPAPNVATVPILSGAPTPVSNSPTLTPNSLTPVPNLPPGPMPSGAPTPAPNVASVPSPSGAPTPALNSPTLTPNSPTPVPNLPPGPMPSGAPTPAPHVATVPSPSGAPIPAPNSPITAPNQPAGPMSSGAPTPASNMPTGPALSGGPIPAPNISAAPKRSATVSSVSTLKGTPMLSAAPTSTPFLHASTPPSSVTHTPSLYATPVGSGAPTPAPSQQPALSDQQSTFPNEIPAYPTTMSAPNIQNPELVPDPNQNMNQTSVLNQQQKFPDQRQTLTTIGDPTAVTQITQAVAEFPTPVTTLDPDPDLTEKPPVEQSPD